MCTLKITQCEHKHHTVAMHSRKPQQLSILTLQDEKLLDSCPKVKIHTLYHNGKH